MNKPNSLRTALLALTFATTLLGCGSGARNEGSGTVAVARQDLEVVVEASGRLEAAVAFEIGPPSLRDVWNYNLKWMVPEGSRVKEGDVVARFDTTDIDERLRNYGAALEKTKQEREKEQRNLEITLEQKRLDLAKAQSEIKKNELELSVPDGLIAAISLEQLRLDRELANLRVRFLKEKIDLEKRLVTSKLELLDVKWKRNEQLIAQNEEALQRYVVKAPSNGVIVYVPKQNGDRWEVGERVWMLAKILKVADVRTLRVEAEVLEVDAARIAVGQPASFTIDAIPGSRVETSVDGIGRLVRARSFQDQSKIFDAYLAVPEVDEETMRPGMSIKTTIRVEVLKDRLTLPVSAVRLGDEGPYVELAAGGRRAIEVGTRSGDTVVVTTGLNSGDRVRLPKRRNAA
jgi:HlyD family secretion protein